MKASNYNLKESKLLFRPYLKKERHVAIFRWMGYIFLSGNTPLSTK